MATVVFDFDSTIISSESLEVILERQLENNPGAMYQIKRITEQGLKGEVPFAESLAKRLDLAAPSRKGIEEFGASAVGFLTAGFRRLILNLKAQGVDVWVLSGGIRESILPLCLDLSVLKDHVHAVQILWDEKGDFKEIDRSSPFYISKVEGAKKLVKRWSPPVIAVGDSFSDYRLYEEGLADHFIAFTEHFRCEEVLERGVPEARNAVELKKMLEKIING